MKSELIVSSNKKKLKGVSVNVKAIASNFVEAWNEDADGKQIA